MKIQIIKGYRGPLTDGRQYVPGDVWTVDDERAYALIKQGVAKEAVAALPKSKPVSVAAALKTVEPKPVVMVDNPADHPVSVVAAYVAAYPGEMERIMTAEEQGQNRATLLRALRAMKGQGR